jgi:hypothetical protein
MLKMQEREIVKLLLVLVYKIENQNVHEYWMPGCMHIYDDDDNTLQTIIILINHTPYIDGLTNHRQFESMQHPISFGRASHLILTTFANLKLFNKQHQCYIMSTTRKMVRFYMLLLTPKCINHIQYNNITIITHS